MQSTIHPATFEPTAPMRPPVAARPSASTVVVRQANRRLEVLMLRRVGKQDQNGGAWVFPGGVVEASDAACTALCDGVDGEGANARLARSQGGLEFFVAAARECLEEAGIFPGLRIDDRSAPPDLHALQARINLGEATFAEVCHASAMRIDVQGLRHISHWITPVEMPKRFDTCFFLSRLRPGQTVRHDAAETVDHDWLTPAEWLAANPARRVLGVTRAILETLGGFSDCDALLAWADALRSVPATMRRRCIGRHGTTSVLPDHPAWAEVGLLDPEGRGTVWCELRPSVPVRLSEHVWRVVRDDTGANVYWIGAPGGDWLALAPKGSPAEVGAPPTTGRILGACGVTSTTSEESLRRAAAAGYTFLPLFSAGGERAFLGLLFVEARTLFLRDSQDLPPMEKAGAVDWLAPARGFMTSATVHPGASRSSDTNLPPAGDLDIACGALQKEPR